MPDFYATIADADPAIIAVMATAMESRATDPRQAAMRDAFLDAIPFPQDATVIEIGCGTGQLCRALSDRKTIASLIGIDPSAPLLEEARARADHLRDRLEFIEADGRSTGLAPASADVVILYTTLCHVPGPELLIAEAHRILHPAGVIAVFDGDYATTSVALHRDDPLQCCIAAFLESFVYSPRIVRALGRMLHTAGFVDLRTQSHGYAVVDNPTYMQSVVGRGADALAAAGTIGPDLAQALKQEAEQRVAERRFFGQISYFHAIALKP